MKARAERGGKERVGNSYCREKMTRSPAAVGHAGYFFKPLDIDSEHCNKL